MKRLAGQMRPVGQMRLAGQMRPVGSMRMAVQMRPTGLIKTEETEKTLILQTVLVKYWKRIQSRNWNASAILP